MGRQWLHSKREVAAQKKAKVTSKLVREISVAAKLGGADPALNARLAAAVEKARKDSVSRDVIERAIKKGAGIGDEKMVVDHVVYEGYAPHKVPIIVEVYTDNVNRTAGEMRVLFRGGQQGSAGSNKFLFEQTGIVEAHHPETGIDIEAAAIEAGANEVEPLSATENDDIPESVTGARFLVDRAALHSASQWLTENGWTVVTSELGYLPRQFTELTEEQRIEVGEFLQNMEDHDDVHRVWAAVK